MALQIAGISAVFSGTTSISKIYQGEILLFETESGGTAVPAINGAPTTYTDTSSPITNETFSHTAIGGNKLLIVTIGTVRNSNPAVCAVTYGGASPDVSNQITHGSSNGRPMVHYALFNAPTPGANNINVTWDGEGSKQLTVFAINLANAASIVTQANSPLGTWGNNGDHSIDVADARSLVIGILAGRGTDVFSGVNSSNMTEAAYAQSNAAAGDGGAIVSGIFYTNAPGVGAFAADMNFDATGTDWVLGITLEVGAA